MSASVDDASVDGRIVDIDEPRLRFGSLFVNGVDVMPLVDAAAQPASSRRRQCRQAPRPKACARRWVAGASAGRRRWRTSSRGRSRTPTSRTSWSWPRRRRHLVLATDAWLAAGSCRCSSRSTRSADLHRRRRDGLRHVDLPLDPPPYDEILAVRAERQGLVTDFLATATGAPRRGTRQPVGGDDWHPTVGDCIRVILEEEWAHLRYVRRDLARLR